MRNFVTEPWVNDLDFTGMERVNAKLYSDKLERRDGDIVVRIPFANQQQEIYLLLLLEFQSTIDPWMAVRFGSYVCLLYQHLIKEKQLTVNDKLPPVFPLLLYNGDREWRAETSLASLIALPDNTPLWNYQPQMRYYLVDESRYPNGKAGSLSGLIFKLENAKTPEVFSDALNEMFDTMPTHLDSLKRAVFVWIRHVLAPHKGIKLGSLEAEGLDEVKIMLATRIKQWEKDLIAQGVQQGVLQGFERGAMQERETSRKRSIALLNKTLSFRFGSLPDWAQQRIQQANIDEIDAWTDRLSDCDTLEDILRQA